MKMRVLLFILLTIFCAKEVVFAEEPSSIAQPNPITQPQNISFENCTKMFAIDKEKLFYLTLGAVSANKFTVDEIQTENGYIIFSVAKNKYLATIAGIDAQNSILKITPCNDIYFFPPGVLINMFKYIDINANTDFKS